MPLELHRQNFSLKYMQQRSTVQRTTPHQIYCKKPGSNNAKGEPRSPVCRTNTICFQAIQFLSRDYAFNSIQFIRSIYIALQFRKSITGAVYVAGEK